jgi:hypothetical protein
MYGEGALVRCIKTAVFTSWDNSKLGFKNPTTDSAARTNFLKWYLHEVRDSQDPKTVVSDEASLRLCG